MRLINVVLPKSASLSICADLEDLAVVSCWSQPLNEETGLVSLFVRAEHSEAILDKLQDRFGARDDFRIILLPVEATIPRIEDPPKSKDIDESESKPAKPSLPLRISREELYEDINAGIKLTWIFVLLAALSAVVAAIGLIRNDIAVLVGAMVIAPLLTPNMALALSTTLADMTLARRALLSNIVGSSTAFVLAVIFGSILTFDPHGPAIAGRANVGLGDIVLALSAGIVGSLAFTTGVASGLIGVMVAVALMPPIVATGLLVGAREYTMALDASLLLATNIICVNLAGVVTFAVQGVRPRNWWEADRAKRASTIAGLIWAGLLVVLILIVSLAESRSP